MSDVTEGQQRAIESVRKMGSDHVAVPVLLDARDGLRIRIAEEPPGTAFAETLCLLDVAGAIEKRKARGEMLGVLFPERRR